jgi:eukaryotic-like serine/threonine-protein kinase
MTSHSPLGRLLDVPRVDNDDERRAIWRQGMATLARVALEQQPVPLEGLDPMLLLESVRSAFQHDLLQDLSWLSPPGAAAAVYELASAIPVGPERRKLGREVLTRLYEGDAETFIVLATSLAAESKRTLTGVPIRARIALSLSLPLGSGAQADALALALLTRADLRREWLIEPASGSLTSRHLAARLLERAARDCARRAAQGDTGALRAFQDPSIKTPWQLLLLDRESLVWRHVATARGLLAKAIPDFAEEIETQQNPALSPTEWRRAAVSLGASVAIDPREGYQRCRALLANETLRSDPGLIETMIFGLARAAEVEPEIAEDLLEQIVRLGGLEAAEALVELRRERVTPEFGARSARIARDKLRKWQATHPQEDDGRSALCEALIEELGDNNDSIHNLRDELDHARNLFVERDARHAYTEAWRVWQNAKDKLLEIETSREDSRDARKRGFRLLRELDEALLQTTALTDLLSVGAANTQTQVTDSLNELFERLTTWLLRVEAAPVLENGAVSNLALRLRRMRTLLHLVDADGQYGEDTTGQRRLRRLRALEMLLARVKHDAASPLRRIVCATLARALDASMRDDVCELSDAVIAVADHVLSAHDVATVAEASMLVDFQRSLTAYAQLMRFCERAEPTGRHARFGIDALRELGQSLPWANTLRVSALRGHLLTVARWLEEIAASQGLIELTTGAGRDRVTALDSSVTALCRLVRGARRRLSGRTTIALREGGTLEPLALALERAEREGSDPLRRALALAHETLHAELPEPIAKTLMLVLQRLEQLPLRAEVTSERRSTSFAPSVPKEAPLPGWLTGRRTLGGFYVLHALGTGGVGSVFVVKRVEERHRDDAVRFALKVPDYSAEAARTLSEEQFLQLFQQEAGALLALPRHTNLAAFVTFDAGARPKPILVMELVEGPTLERVLERGDLTLASALTLIDGIGAGLEAMHHVGIGHLDLKPSNVILRSQQRAHGEVITPVLVDFGLAGRHLRPGCGTGLYGAPEVWGLIPAGHQPKPASADVYSFACLIFEVLTGKPLFEADNELAVINAHLSHDGYPNALRNLAGRGGRQELCELLFNGLRSHPAERINIAEIRDGLRELAPALRKHGWPLRAA